MKKILITVMILTMMVAAVGCGSSENGGSEDQQNPTTTNNIEAVAMAQYLNENVTFEDYMDVIDEDILFEVYGLDPDIVTEACSYFSTGATAEEIIVVKSDDIEAVMSAYDARIDSQIKGFENYVPEELTKLSTPFKMVYDDVIVMVVCDDVSEAEEAANSYIESFGNNQ